MNKNGKQQTEKNLKKKMKAYLQQVFEFTKLIKPDNKEFKILVLNPNIYLVLKTQKKKQLLDFNSEFFETLKMISKFPKFDKYKTTMSFKVKPFESLSQRESKTSTNDKQSSSSENEEEDQTKFISECMTGVNSLSTHCNKEADDIDTTISLANVDSESLQNKSLNLRKSFISKYMSSIASVIKQMMKNIESNNSCSNSLLFMPPTSSLYDENKTLFRKCMSEQTESSSLKRAIKELKQLFGSKVQKKIDAIYKSYCNDDPMAALRILNEVDEVKETLNYALIADACNTIGCIEDVAYFFNKNIQQENKDYSLVIKKSARFLKVVCELMIKPIKNESGKTISFYKLIDKQQIEFYKDLIVVPLFESFYSQYSNISEGTKDTKFDRVKEYESNQDNLMLIEIEVYEEYAKAMSMNINFKSSNDIESADMEGLNATCGKKSEFNHTQIIIPPYMVLTLLDKTFNHIRLGF